jgi:hypothetical protein
MLASRPRSPRQHKLAESPTPGWASLLSCESPLHMSAGWDKETGCLVKH